MKSRSIILNKHAISSHLLDTVLLLGIAVLCFVIISSNFLPLTLPSFPPNVELSAYIRGDYLFIEHMGGESLNYDKIRIEVIIGDEPKIKPKLIEKNNNNVWECGEYVMYFYNTSDLITLLIVDEETNTILLHGNLKRGEKTWIGSIPPILVSSLRTDSEDEDLICYSLPQENFNARTYIYNWKKDGQSIFEVLLPFDTMNSNSVKDYSGNSYNGIVHGAKWISNGKIGGAYSFDGMSDGITLPLPNVFGDWNNNFTISFWMKSRDIETDSSKRCVMEAYIDKNNSIQIFQINSSINFAFKINGKVKYSIKTPVLKNDTWYFISLVWKSNQPNIYINGTLLEIALAGERNYESGNSTSLSIGRRSDGNNSFYGILDEFYIFRYARSSRQIYQDYIDSKDGESEHRVLVSDEIKVGDAWSCTVIPNDSTRDGEPIDSNILIVKYYGGGT